MGLCPELMLSSSPAAAAGAAGAPCAGAHAGAAGRARWLLSEEWDEPPLEAVSCMSLSSASAQGLQAAAQRMQEAHRQQ